MKLVSRIGRKEGHKHSPNGQARKTGTQVEERGMAKQVIIYSQPG